MVSFVDKLFCNSSKKFKAISDKYKSIEQVYQALRQSGLESSNLIIAIDYTKSNENTGAKSFGGKSLHFIANNSINPYQSAITIIGQTLEPFDDDKLIPVFGFGDIRTKNQSVFPFYQDKVCYTFKQVLDRYNEITPMITLSGPTNFAPVIYEAINIVKISKLYHILVIIADGQVVNEEQTREAIVEASKYPLSILLIGVGDGPWDLQKEFDNKLPKRNFDNYQFVNYHEIISKCTENPEPTFAMMALMEIPEQYKQIRKLGYL